MGWSGCPSGFTVQNGSGVKGFITAAHCGNILSWNGVNLPFVAQISGANSDSQWHTTASYTAIPAFFYQGTSSRWVTASTTWNNIVVGSFACKNGPATGYTCGTIDSKSYSPSWLAGHANAVFVRVGNCDVNMVSEGDSGGPVFYGFTAYGITSGKEVDIFCGFRNKLIFNAANHATVPLGLSVLLH